VSTASPESNLGARALYWVAIPGCGALGAVQFIQLFSSVEFDTLVPLLLGLLLGIAAADWVTAAVHWACDTWGSEGTPWLGSSVIDSFREHHREPLAMLEHDWLEVNGGAATAALLALVGFSGFSTSEFGFDAGTRILGSAFFLSLVGTSAITNQLHYWAHDPRPPGIIRRLQSHGLILSPIEHVEHHRAPHTHGYCISTGWLNRPLDAIRFWRAMEWGLTLLTGAQPRKDEPDS
jgi:ubiquitin-conjugating enzyme E2 variant